MSTPQTVKAQMQSLIGQSNAATGKTDATLTDAVASLVEGFGQGGAVDEGYIYLPYATRIDYMFHNATFPNDADITVYIPNIAGNGNGLGNSFYNSKGVKKLTLICDNPQDKTVSYTNALYGCSMKILDISQFITTVKTGMTNTFKNNYNLEEIIGEFNPTNASFSGTFDKCEVLREVRFAPNSIRYDISFSYSSLLSDASIQAIIDGLVDLTGQEAKTVTFHANVKAKLTETQIATITNKNWTLA